MASLQKVISEFVSVIVQSDKIIVMLLPCVLLVFSLVAAVVVAEGYQLSEQLTAALMEKLPLAVCGKVS